MRFLKNEWYYFYLYDEIDMIYVKEINNDEIKFLHVSLMKNKIFVKDEVLKITKFERSRYYKYMDNLCLLETYTKIFNFLFGCNI